MALNLATVSSPQYSALTGIKKKLPLAAVIRAHLPAAILAGEREAEFEAEGKALEEKTAVEKEALDLQKELEGKRLASTESLQKLSLAQSARQFDESMGLKRDEMAETGKQSKTASGVSLANTAITAGTLADKLGLINIGKDAAVAAPAATTIAGTTAAPEIAGTGTSLAQVATSATPQTATFGRAAEGLAGGLRAAAGAPATFGKAAEGMAAGLKGSMGMTAGKGAAASSAITPLSYLGPAAFGAGVGFAVQRVTDNKLYGALAGAASGAIAGFIYGGGPVGAIIGGLSGFIGGVCIIVSSCTHRYSHEVNISREYRDKFLDPVTLYGYYRLAEKIVPAIKKHDLVKRMVKKGLVDRLVDYGEWALGYKDIESMRFEDSERVTKAFLGLCYQYGLQCRKKEGKTFDRVGGIRLLKGEI